MPFIIYNSKRYPLCRPLRDDIANAIIDNLRAPASRQLARNGYVLMRQAVWPDNPNVPIYLSYIGNRLTWNYRQGVNEAFRLWTE
jgi:hypothetical protein